MNHANAHCIKHLIFLCCLGKRCKCFRRDRLEVWWTLRINELKEKLERCRILGEWNDLIKGAELGWREAKCMSLQVFFMDVEEDPVGRLEGDI
jgi:hypothetical protein